MNYPAILTYEGTRVLAAFPDCPGCQTFAESDDEILPLAQEALESWLEVGLEDDEVPPKPSDLELAERLEAAWVRRVDR